MVLSAFNSARSTLMVCTGYRLLLRLLLHFDLARVEGRTGHPCTLANDNFLENARITSLNLERFGE